MDKNIVVVESYAARSAENEINLKNNKTDEKIKKYSYQDFKETVNDLCHLFFRIFYVVYGFIQFFATWAGLVKVFNDDNTIILLSSFILGFTPFIGTVFGIYGACIGWGWSLGPALFVFITPYFIANGSLLLIAFFDIYKDGKRWKTEKNA